MHLRLQDSEWFLLNVSFAPGQKYVKHADVIKPVQKEDMPFSRIVSVVFLLRSLQVLSDGLSRET